MGEIYKIFSEKNSIDINSIYLCYNERVIIQKLRIQEFLNYDNKKRNEIKIYAALKDDEMKFLYDGLRRIGKGPKIGHNHTHTGDNYEKCGIRY